MPFENPFQGQSPILGPMARAFQLYSVLQQLKGDELDRKFRQDQAGYQRTQDAAEMSHRDRVFKLNEDEHQYGRKQNALKTTLALNEMGAKFGDPRAEEALTALMGAPKDPRTAVQTPEGKTAYLPTQRETRQRSLEDILSKGRIETAVDLERIQGLFPYKVGEIEAREKYQQQFATPTQNRVTPGGVILDRQGNTIGVNQDVAKSKTAAEKKAPMTQINDVENKKAIAQAALKEAQVYSQYKNKVGGFDDPEIANKYNLALAKAKAAEDEAIALAATLKKLFPNNYSYQVDKDNNISQDWKD